jgi:acyl-CoA synthetase (AMP-forming)/AMP-acid ligase II
MIDPPEGWQPLGIDAVAARFPDAIAVADNAGSCTYGELIGRVGSAAKALQARGVRTGETVLLIAPNSTAAVAVYLAALRLGVLVVLLDRRAGQADVVHAIEAIHPRLVVADPDVAAAVCPPELPVLALADAVACAGDVSGGVEMRPERIAVVLFTSGTSSTPKGVQHSMRSLLAGVRNLAHTLSFTRQDAAFLVSPLASITGVVQLHLALECGGRLLLEDAFSPASSVQRFVELGATVFGGAPFVLEQLLAAAGGRPDDVLPLRAVAVGGASIPRELLQVAFSRHAIAPSRVYGSSECPNAFASAPDDELEARLRDEGVAMPGTEARIDPENGELQLRGENLFAGYLDSAHNAEAFTADGWLRTGDQADLRAGRLRITGRLKEVVARKGLKISMAEVDELLRGMPQILAATTYGLPDSETGERLAVALHVVPGSDLGLQDVSSWLLAAGLAKWKLPEEIVLWHESFPCTASGKVLRRALADGGAGRPTRLAQRLQGAAARPA